MATFIERAKLATRAAIGVFSDTSMREAHGMFQGIYPAQHGEPPVRGTRDRLAAYRELPWLRACAERVGNAIASAEWQLFVARKNGTAVRDRSLQRAAFADRHAYIKKAVQRGDVTQIDRHVFLDQVLDRGNSFLTGHATRKVTQLHVDLAGEAFWLKERNPLGAVVGVWPLPPHWVQDTPTPGYRFYRVGFRSWQGDIPDSEILWMANPDPENPYARGTGITGSMAMDLETDEYAKKWMRQFFYNSGRPDFVVYPKSSGGEPGQMSPVEAKRLEQSWLNQHQGFWRAFKPMFASREIGIHEFQQNMQTTQGIPLLEHERNVIVQTWGFPPEILGVLESCVDDQTECLTRAGWKRHSDLTTEDEIGTWNVAGECFEWQHPSEVHRFDHDGAMHHWRGDRVDFLCTPNHRMYRGDQRGDWEMRTSDEHQAEHGWFQWRLTGGNHFGTIRTVTIPPHVSKRPTRRPDDDGAIALDVEHFGYFLGAFISEGYADTDGNVWISQNEGPTADKMRGAMEALDLGPVCIRKRVNRQGVGNVNCEFRVTHRGLASWLRDEVGHGARNKRIPQDVFDWPRAAQEHVLDGLMDGDGSLHSNGAERYGSASERLVDDLQRLLVVMGYPAAKTGQSKPKQALWNVCTRRLERPIKRGNAAYATVGNYGERAAWMTETHYTGVVWCVTVPNGLFFTRRNGRVVCHGNSNRATIDGAAYIMAKYVELPRLEFFRAIWQEKLIPEYDDRLILHFVSPVQDDKVFQLETMKAAPWAATVNEWRDLQGLPPDKQDGDKRLVPFQLQAVDSLDDVHAPTDVDPGANPPIPAPDNDDAA